MPDDTILPLVVAAYHYQTQVILSAAVNWHRATDADVDETCARLHQVVADYLTAGGAA